MKSKIWIWLFLIVTILLGIVFFYINYAYYAGVIDIGIFTVALGMQLFLGIYAMRRQEKSPVYAGLLIMIYVIVVLIIGVQNYTYADAEDVVMNSYEADDVKLLALDHKTVPTDESSWYLSNKDYYVAVKKDETKQVDYYSVDPVEGKPVKLDEPYWSESHQ